MPGNPSDIVQDYIRLKDFTPGIYSASMRSLASTAAVPAPLGAAQTTNTYRCIALPQGGLAPLPGNSTVYGVPIPDQSNVQNGGRYYPTMIRAFGAITPTVAGANPEELFFGLGYIFKNSGAQPLQPRLWVYRLQMWAAASNFPPADSIFGVIATAANTNTLFGQSHCITRIHPTTYTSPGTPIFVFDQNNGTSAEFAALLWPNPSTPTVNQSFSYSGKQLNVFAHQGRVVCLVAAQYAHPGVQPVAINEQINFSDPPNSFSDPTSLQDQVFVPENPIGYGAWGSMSVGELFLVKHLGGAVYVTGDIANPTVTRLPGVVSTGGLISMSASTPIGFMYPTLSSGMYLWNGGNTSQHISKQLDDSFYNIPSVVGFQGVSCQVEPWADWVLVSNNWLYDTITRSWWRLEDPTQTLPNFGIPTGPIFRYYSRSYADNIMYASVDSFVNNVSGSFPIWVYDRTKPAFSFSWQSHPIPVTTQKTVDVVELILLAQGQGQVYVTLTDANGNPQQNGPDTFNINSPNQPVRLRLRTYISGYNIVVRIQSQAIPEVNAAGTQTFPAPVVYELDLGWRESNLAAAN